MGIEEYLKERRICYHFENTLEYITYICSIGSFTIKVTINYNTELPEFIVLLKKNLLEQLDAQRNYHLAMIKAIENSIGKINFLD